MVSLDDKQRKVVYTDAPMVLVAAAAGAGKTTCVTERLKFLLSSGYESKNVYAITYTNAAAEEMRSRLDKENPVFIGTIHSLANRILLLNGIDTTWMLQTENFDLLFQEFIKNKDLKLPQVDYILIDEFQDICKEEYDFIFNLLKPKEFMVVGDARQAIYGFKGSNYQYFMDLIEDPRVTVFELNYNYRCGEDIIDFAENFVWSLDDIYQVGSECRSGKFGMVRQETFTVDNLLLELEGYDYKDIFILTRSNKEIEDIKFILNKYNIPNDSFKKADLDRGQLKEMLEKNSVKILTVHSAKGLEAKKVMVVGVKGYNNEERRVCYVAATRAMDELIWFRAAPKKKAKIRSWG